jgi:hypothetical protein
MTPGWGVGGGGNGSFSSTVRQQPPYVRGFLPIGLRVVVGWAQKFFSVGAAIILKVSERPASQASVSFR